MSRKERFVAKRAANGVTVAHYHVGRSLGAILTGYRFPVEPRQRSETPIPGWSPPTPTALHALANVVVYGPRFRFELRDPVGPTTCRPVWRGTLTVYSTPYHPGCLKPR